MKCKKCGKELIDSLCAEAFKSPYRKPCKLCGRHLFISNMPNTIEPVYFEITLGKCKHEYPEVEPFLTWMESKPRPEDDDVSMVAFSKEYWAYLHHLCIIVQVVNQTYVDFCVTADKKWVKQKCPCLLTTHTQFLIHPNKQGEYIGSLGNKFLDYDRNNWGIYFVIGNEVLDTRCGSYI